MSHGVVRMDVGHSGDVSQQIPDKQQQTLLWQQNQYMDSGINSGATTQAASVSSKHGLEDEEMTTTGW